MTKLLHTAIVLYCTVFMLADASSLVNLTFVQKTVNVLAVRDSITPDDVANLKPQLDNKPSGKNKPLKLSGKAGRRKMKGSTDWKTDDWQVAVIQDKEYFCGGALIASQWVLTAAQCAYQRTEFEVILGVQTPSVVFTAGRASFKTSIKIVHSDYNPATLHSDIALIQLPVEILLLPTDYVNTILLPKKADATKSFETSVAAASGWKSGSLESPSFYSLSMTVISSSECAAVFGKSSITSSNLCAQTTANLETFCNGDIGSPLVLKTSGDKYTQIGILSFRATDCSSNRPACFTRVSSFLGWISEYADLAIS